MGREAVVDCQIGAQAEPVKALLESKELVLRGAQIKRRWALASLSEVRAEGPLLQFTADGEPVSLSIGEPHAQRWAEKMLAPPPSLASKLGISAAKPAWVLGAVDDAELAAALAGATTGQPAQAAVVLAVVLDEPALAQALRQHAAVACPLLWLVHAKGRGALLGDTAIRQAMRAQGYIDNKTSAVSAQLTATRYARK